MLEGNHTPVEFHLVVSPLAAVKHFSQALQRFLRPSQQCEVGCFFEHDTRVLAAFREALVVQLNPVTAENTNRIVELAAQHRLPTMYYVREFVDPGGLVSYGPHLHENYRQAATLVDKILKGTRPSDLPIEQPTKFELVVNLKAAKALGLTVPQTLLQRADEVVQ